MNIYQYILAVIAIGFMVNRMIRFVRRERYQTVVKLITVLLVWGSILYIAVFPRSWHALAARLGLGGNADLVILIGFISVYLLIFRMLSFIERIERHITILVRRDALQNLPKE